VQYKLNLTQFMVTPIMKRVLNPFLVVCLLAILPAAAYAEWVEDGVPAILNPANQHDSRAISDGAGGVIAVFQYDNILADIYAQRWDSRGNIMWGANGAAICIDPGFQDLPELVSDGAGGAIIVWEDLRSGFFDVYAQRVDAGGNVLWAAGGVQITFELASERRARITTDGAGGAIIAWMDAKLGNNDIYAQRLNSAGVNQWLLGGVAVCTAASSQGVAEVISDGAGGAIIAWSDFRGGPDNDIYAQRIDSSGIGQWTFNGEPVVAAVENQQGHGIATDMAGGAIIVWQDFRDLEFDIYAQRLDASGTAQWRTDGVNLCTETDDQRDVEIISDGAGGAIVAWEDYRDGLQNDVYAQRVTGSGLGMWEFNGVLIGGSNGDQVDASLAMDGEGGAVITWTDGRGVEPNDVYAQRVNEYGQIAWAFNGVPVGAAARSQHDAIPVPTTDGGFIVVFDDLRAGWGLAYAQRIGRNYGEWGNPEPVISSVADVPADQGGVVNVNWLASGRDNLDQQLIGSYSIWRAIDQTAFAAATTGGEARGKVVLLSAAPSLFDRDTYMVQHTAAGDYFWQWIGDQPSTYSPAYSFPAETQFDSVSVNPGIHYFRVIAHHTWDQYRFWESNPDSGYSVDNVAPGSPFFLTAMRAGGSDVDLDWSPSGLNEPDFMEYWVYRGLSTGFPTDAGHFLLTSPDTMAIDTDANPGTAFYYKVVAVDIHDNESDDSNEASVSGATGVDDTPPSPAALQVLANSPNPFSYRTDLRFGLPHASDVSLEIYDVAGRRVYNEHRANVSAGWQRIAYDGRDANGVLLPSGVYFYRVSAAGMATTSKMVIRR
jgi:hypothetical protein